MLRNFAKTIPLLLVLVAGGGCQDAVEIDARDQPSPSSMVMTLADAPAKSAVQAKLVEARSLKKVRYAGKRLKANRTFALSLADKQGGTVTVLFTLEGDKARLLVLGADDQAALLWDTDINSVAAKRTAIEIKGSELVVGKTALPAKSIKDSGKVPLVAVEGDLSGLVGEIGRLGGGATATYMVPNYPGCCSDCCSVHETVGLPDWTDAFCCMGNCGGSGSCTPSSGGDEGLDPDKDADEAEVVTAD